MPAVIIRNLSDETHRALKQRALANGTSTEAEIRAILEETVKPESRLRIGTELASFARKFSGFDLDPPRDSRPTEPAKFE